MSTIVLSAALPLRLILNSDGADVVSVACVVTDVSEVSGTDVVSDTVVLAADAEVSVSFSTGLLHEAVIIMAAHISATAGIVFLICKYSFGLVQFIKYGMDLSFRKSFEADASVVTVIRNEHVCLRDILDLIDQRIYCAACGLILSGV